MKFESKKMILADGGLHHLGAKEEDVSKTMILTCAAEDIPRIASHLKDARQTASHREYVTYKGLKGDSELAVMSFGHGCMPMAIAVEELNQLGVKTIVKIGAGQAIQPGIRPGTIIIPSAAVRSEGASKEYIPESYPACADLSLVRRFVKAFRNNGISPEVGIIRSHDGYYNEQPCDPKGMERIARWSEIGVLMNEHECSSMFTLAELFRMHAASIEIVRENLIDGTELSEGEFRRIEDEVFKIVINELAG